MISGKVLTNKNIEECLYSYNYDLCIPKGYELNCMAKNSVEETDEEETNEKETDVSSSPFKTCEENNIEVSTNGKCGEGYGKCPSDQCCGKNGECGTSEDYCYISNNCQMNYGNCKDECEELYEKLGNRINDIQCTSNKQGKAQKM